MNFILGFTCAVTLFSLCTLFFCFGFMAAANDAEKRLKGKTPVDDFWRKRGMK